ncbi:MAG: DNA mismatch repair endonuclease MutL [Flavobacteriaceae bacterium]|nr:DNA mismatch repair endonuclease MutL [Flavobacteriaceae bacterium]
MSDVIRLLPDHVANQIAAGEVVQRPASVVKELLENAIDAGANSIKLIVKDAGRQGIEVIDNGVGMSGTDARMAFERHATSKISRTEDIFQIRTKGFRGEALASIAAVAQVDLRTRRETEELGTHIVIHGGELKSQEPVVTPVGTMISVRNLFYNVPARRNFLKSNQVELRHILDEFHRVALAHESIDFQLISNDVEVFRLTGTHTAQRILHIFGKKMQGQLVPVNEETDVVKITGFIGKPESAKKSRGEQFFFANNRFIKSGYLHKALQHAFENLISPGEHPAYFIFLEIDPEKIDINIHPTKTEIKFEDEAAIYGQLRAAVKHALGQYQVTPALDFDRPDWDIPIMKQNRDLKMPEIQVDRNYNPFQTEFNLRGMTTPGAGGTFHHYELETHAKPSPELFSKAEETPLKVMQWQQAYLITEYQDDLLLIDQHRAHQSVLYQKFIKSKNKNALSQQLLFAIEMELSHNEKEKIKNSEEFWIGYGFDFVIDEDLLMVNAIPGDMQSDMILPLFQDFLSSDEAISTTDPADELAKYMAKAASIKKGTRLGVDQMQHLVQELFALEQFIYSPFGKRIFKSINLHEISKFLD